jgi:hypothetical protein
MNMHSDHQFGDIERHILTKSFTNIHYTKKDIEGHILTKSFQLTAAESVEAAPGPAAVAICKAPDHIRPEAVAGSARIRPETEHDLCTKFQPSSN